MDCFEKQCPALIRKPILPKSFFNHCENTERFSNGYANQQGHTDMHKHYSYSAIKVTENQFLELLYRKIAKLNQNTWDKIDFHVKELQVVLEPGL